MRLGTGHILPAVVFAIAAVPAAASEEHPGFVELQEEVRKQDTNETMGRLLLEPTGTIAPLPDSWVLYVQAGWGHGQSFDFLRVEVTGAELRLERVKWQGRRQAEAPFAAEATTGPLTGFAQEIAWTEALIHSRVRRGPAPQTRGGRLGSGSGDFLTHVRLEDPDGTVLFDQAFAGYPGDLHLVKYAALRPVAQGWMGRAAELDGWSAVAPRTSHFTRSWMTNVELMKQSSGWWVYEYGMEALAAVGNRDALETIRLIEEHIESKGLSEAEKRREEHFARDGVSPTPGEAARARRKAKAEALVDDPDAWLAGPARVLREGVAR